MSKKLKALLCAMLAGTILATSTGLTVLAADETTSAQPEAAAATEIATEATTIVDGAEVQVTPAPETEGMADVTPEEQDDLNSDGTEGSGSDADAPEEDKYTEDTYYQRALSVCSALGIIQGYDDGSIQPESTVTRAEMTAIILRLIAIDPTATYQDIFEDVTTSHWAASVIETGVEQKIIDGMGDGTFIPDGPVKYEQVLKMIVCAMNYGLDAETQGGYPQGYVSVALNNLELGKNVRGMMGDNMPRGEVIKSIFNALLGKYKYIASFKNNDPSAPIYATGKTLGEEKFDMKEATGILTTTPNVSIVPNTKKRDGVVIISGNEYTCTLNVDDYIATKVKYYYLEKDSLRDNIIALVSMDKAQEHTFADEYIDSVDTVAGELKVLTSLASSSTRKYKINDITIIYNGSLFVYPNGQYDNIVKPEVGTIKIIDYDDDGIYDVMFVESYIQMVVTTATTEKLTGYVDGVKGYTIEYDLDDANYEVSVKKAGVDASPKNLKKDDVASIKMNRDNTKIEIIVTGDAVTGTVDNYNATATEMEITIDGKEYKVDRNAWASGIKHGVNGTFYFDAFGRVGRVDLAGTLAENETYGVIAHIYSSEDGTDIIRIINQDGNKIEAKLAGSAKVWLPGSTAAVNNSAAVRTALANDATYIPVGSSGMPLKLCKYRINSANEITKLYVAVSATDAAGSTDALVAYTNTSGTNTLRSVSSVGGSVDGYYIQDNIVKFLVPDKAADRIDAKNYSTGTVNSSTYKSYDGGYDHDYTIADFTDDRYPNVLVEFATSASSVSGVTAIGNASNNPTFMVSKITKAVDDEDNIVFKLTGYVDGSEIVYTTTSTTGVYDLNPSFPNGIREYAATATLYDATEDDASAFTNNVHIGDVFLVGANGADIHTLIRIATVQRVVKSFANSSAYPTGQWMQHISPSSTREHFYSGFIGKVDISDSAFIDIVNSASSAVGSIAYDSSKTFSLVTVTLDALNNITDITVDKDGGIKPDELVDYDPAGDVIDYIICKSFKGSMGSGYIIRIEK